jgi:antitoxin component YwqK of YwqJK toxin-antitoxin module
MITTWRFISRTGKVSIRAGTRPAKRLGTVSVIFFFYNPLEYYNNGRIKYEGAFINDKFNGNAVKVRNEEGVIVYWGAMVEGKFQGKGIEYHQTGKMKALGNFEDGLLSDPLGKVYSIEGVLEFMGQFENGVKNGPGSEYHKDGSVKSHGIYKKNQKDGLHYTFYQYQVKTREDILKNDLEALYHQYLRELRRKNFSVQYKIPIKSIISYQLDSKQNMFLEFYENKRLYMLGKFRDDIMGHKITIYDKSGFVVYKGEHLNSIPHGYGVKFYPDATNRQYAGLFKNGLPDGDKIQIFDKATGNLIYEGAMKCGQIEGRGKRYNPNNGRLRLKGNFSNGLLHGENCKVYDKHGHLLYHGGMDRNKRQGVGNLYFNLGFITDYQYKKKYTAWAYGLLWGLSAVVPASLMGGVAWRFSLLAAELTSYGGLAAFLGVSTGTIGTLVMALDNIKFCVKTSKFNLRVDTQKRLCICDKKVEIAKNWLIDHPTLFLTGNWDNDKLAGEGRENRLIDLWTKDSLENVKMSYGNVELLDLHLTLG